jgi:c-di-GMP-binding flagellar brake protein YcgR
MAMGILNFSKKTVDDNHLLFSSDLIMQTQMRKNLEYVCQKNLQLIAVLDERVHTFSSIFLEIGKNNSFVVIDILIPDHGNQFLKTSAKMRIDYTIEGIMYSFDTKFIEAVNGRFPSIRIAFPSTIKKIQRRRHFRVSPSVDKPIIVRLIKGIDEKVADISEGGLAIYTHLTERELALEKVFERLIFRLPHVNCNIITKAVLRNLIRGNGESIKNRCGIEFVDIGISDRGLIASYVLMRQRESISRSAERTM